MREQILESLDNLVGVGKPKEVWAVYYEPSIKSALPSFAGFSQGMNLF